MLKVRLLTDDSDAVSELKKLLAGRDAWFPVSEQSYCNLDKFSSSVAMIYGALRMELDLVCAASSLLEHATRDLINMVCTRYSSLVHAQSISYCDRLNNALTAAQMRGEYPGGFLEMLSSKEKSLHKDEANSEEKRAVKRRLPAPVTMKLKLFLPL